MKSDGHRRMVLVLFAHPALEKSRVNRELIRGLDEMDGVTFHDLYEEYPEFNVDTTREQALLVAHEVILFQHPFYWYSVPALLKEWQDLVLEHGWAYGHEGTALRGKQFLSVITTGGKEEAYCPGGFNRFTCRDLLAPLEQTAHLCGMEFLPPFIVHGTHGMSRSEMRQHARDYHRLLAALRDGHVDTVAANRQIRMNKDLDAVITV